MRLTSKISARLVHAPMLVALMMAPTSGITEENLPLRMRANAGHPSSGRTGIMNGEGEGSLWAAASISLGSDGMLEPTEADGVPIHLGKVRVR